MLSGAISPFIAELLPNFTMMNNWFDTARLGMFIHWGYSSQIGCELSWPLVGGVFSLPFCKDILKCSVIASLSASGVLR